MNMNLLFLMCSETNYLNLDKTCFVDVGACNIKDEGMRIIGSSTTEFTLVDYPTMDDMVATPLKSSDMLKQENHNEQRSKFVQV